MDKDKIIASVKDKVKLPDGVADKLDDLLDGDLFKGKIDKDEIMKTLKDKLKIDEKKADEVYQAIKEALSGGILDKIKGFFKKK